MAGIRSLFFLTKYCDQGVGVGEGCGPHLPPPPSYIHHCLSSSLVFILR